MADPLITVANYLQAAFTELAGGTADPVVRRSDRADAQVNGSLAVAKSLGVPPRDVAERVLAMADLSAMCTATEIGGPGFINLTFSPQFLAREVATAMLDDRLGVRVAPRPLKVVVDYSAPNVAKEMHVGHLRSTIIGDAIVRMLGFVGHDVRRENHIGDWGTPFGMLIEHLIDLGEIAAANELSVGDLDSFYKQARHKFDADDGFKERARNRVVMLQGGDAETLRLWRLLVELSMRYFERVYEMLGVLLTSDDLMGESAYNELLPKVVERLEASAQTSVAQATVSMLPSTKWANPAAKSWHLVTKPKPWA